MRDPEVIARRCSSRRPGAGASSTWSPGPRRPAPVVDDDVSVEELAVGYFQP
ncbi:hypothetical protein HBB16_18475 [Pseudonocardia sp. MCCB 268]|nr:hypothetical protein [Pseudonocardia cytotoxica]